MRKNVWLIAVISIFYSCSPGNAKIDNSLKVYFDSAGVKGSFAFLNNQIGDISVYNMHDDTLRVSPGGSFKIAETLIGIETARLTDENTVMPGSDSSLQSVTLKQAFDANHLNYFQQLARKIGEDTMSFWIDSLKYGNMQTHPLDSFWMNGNMKISPDEQLGLIYKIYFDQLHFQKYAQDVVRQLMLKESNTLYKLSYTTAPAMDGNTPIAWICGWIEENRHVYFFVSVVKADKQREGLEEIAERITRNILTAKGFFKGEK